MAGLFDKIKEKKQSSKARTGTDTKGVSIDRKLATQPVGSNDKLDKTKTGLDLIKQAANNQSLFAIANGEWPLEVLEAAAKKINDEEMLTCIAQSPSAYNTVTSIAVRRIGDSDLLFKLATQSENKHCAWEAAAQLAWRDNQRACTSLNEICAGQRMKVGVPNYSDGFELIRYVALVIKSAKYNPSEECVDFLETYYLQRDPRVKDHPSYTIHPINVFVPSSSDIVKLARNTLCELESATKGTALGNRITGILTGIS